jgi:transcription elongation GreA/GreB family factor
LTPAQRQALADALAELEGPARAAGVQAIKTAREHGDLSENFEYHAAKNEQGLLEARIRTLRGRQRLSRVAARARSGRTNGRRDGRGQGTARLMACHDPVGHARLIS